MKRTRVLFLTTYMTSIAALAVGGCHDKEKAEAAKKVEDEKVENRAKEIAGKMAVDIENKQKVDEAAQKAQKEKADREALLKTPADFFEVSGLKLVDSGPGKQAHSVAAIAVTNKSKFPIIEVQVRVDFLKDGQPAASIPLKLHGALPAGGTKTFSVDDKTLDSATVQTPATENQTVVTAAVLDIADEVPSGGAAKPQP